MDSYYLLYKVQLKIKTHCTTLTLSFRGSTLVLSKVMRWSASDMPSPLSSTFNKVYLSVYSELISISTDALEYFMTLSTRMLSTPYGIFNKLYLNISKRFSNGLISLESATLVGLPKGICAISCQLELISHSLYTSLSTSGL